MNSVFSEWFQGYLQEMLLGVSQFIFFCSVTTSWIIKEAYVRSLKNYYLEFYFPCLDDEIVQ